MNKIKAFIENPTTWKIYRRTLVAIGCSGLLLIVGSAIYGAITGGALGLIEWVILG